MKYIALILSILIATPTMVCAAEYMQDEETILLDNTLGEEEKEEREGTDGEEKEVEYREQIIDNYIMYINLDEQQLSELNKRLSSQYSVEDHTPPPEV